MHAMCGERSAMVGAGASRPLNQRVPQVPGPHLGTWESIVLRHGSFAL